MHCVCMRDWRRLRGFQQLIVTSLNPISFYLRCMLSALLLCVFRLSFLLLTAAPAIEIMASSTSSGIRILPRNVNNACNTLNSGVSILSHNVLLPNSVDGWWVYKMYSARHKLSSTSACSWAARSQVLAEQIAKANADGILHPYYFLHYFTF